MSATGEHDHAICAQRVDAALRKHAEEHGAQYVDGLAVICTTKGMYVSGFGNTASAGNSAMALLGHVSGEEPSGCPTCDAHIAAATHALRGYKHFLRVALGTGRPIHRH